MASTVLSRPNHYDVLGIDPGASGDEIMRAFASKMSHGQRSIGMATQIYAAFETLRDPGKRRAYDDSIGRTAKPQAPAWSIGAPQLGWAPTRAKPVPAGISQPPAPVPTTEPETPVEPKVAAIAASLRELARAAPLEEAPAPKLAPEQRARPEPSPEPDVDHVIADILATGHAEKQRLRFEPTRSPGWRRPALMAGGLVTGVALFGALVGLSVRDSEDAQLKPAASVALPPASPAPAADSSTEPMASPTETTADVTPPSSTTVAKRGPVPEQPTPTIERAVEDQATPPAPDQSAADALAADPLAPASEAAQPATASMPLPKAVIARTIERIGYACGAVASVAEGAGAGVYIVTCTSGQTYQATPVHGRYRFRRMGAR